jgi:hypothetical protein
MAHRWIIAAAWLAAGALVAFGVRGLVARRRGSLFLGYLSLFVAVLTGGCGGQDSARPRQATAASTPIASGPVPSTIEPTPTRAPAQPPAALAQDGRWERFVALWRELDAADTTPTATPIPYAMNNAWRERLDAILSPTRMPTGDWFAEGGLDPLSEALLRFTYHRIENLGPSHSMMTRMMPSRGMMFGEQLFDELEGRFDALVALRQAGHVDDEQFARGLAALEDDAYLSCVIELVGRDVQPEAAGAPRVAPMGPDLEHDAAAWVRGFEAQYARLPPAIQATMQDQQKRVREQLRTLEALRPQLRALLAELER